MQESVAAILIVEDEDIARRNLEHILRKQGYEVIAANSGSKAVDLLRQRILKWRKSTACRCSQKAASCIPIAK